MILKYFIFSFSLFLSAQQVWAEGSVTVYGEEPSVPAKANPAAKEVTEMNELELRELEQKKHLQANSPVSELGQSIDSTLIEMQSLSKKGISVDQLMNSDIREKLIKSLENNPASELPREEVKRMLATQAKGKPMEKIFLQFPQTLEMVTDLTRDRAAIPGILKVMGKTEDLKGTALLLVFIFIMSLFLKNRLIPKNWSFLKRFISKMLFNFVTYAAMLTTVYFSYSAELSPALDIVLKNL